MLQQLLNHIGHYNLLSRDEKVLLAVSGGVDSMVMLDLFIKGGFNIGVAHCNFQLRPEEALREQELVKNVCSNHGIDFELAVFDTEKYSVQHTLSAQVAARNLRYQFFNSLIKTGKYSKVATAHHLNDSLETVLLNFTRGTGPDGLIGIPVKNKNVIRPLLFATREQILEYARVEGLSWLDDSSNFSDDYSRNLIRNKVMPLLRQINPGIERTFTHTVGRMTGGKRIIDDAVKHFNDSGVKFVNGRTVISKTTLRTITSPELILWEVIKAYGFRFDQVIKMMESTQSGAIFYSDNHEIVNDRDVFILQERVPFNFAGQEISRSDARVESDSEILLLQHEQLTEGSLENDAFIASMDADRVIFPLIWRRWQDGDHFCPLGMKHRKKVSDFLIDMKIDRLRKQTVTVVESGGEIIWIVGLRISEKVKITPITKQVLKIRWQPKEI